MSEKNQQSGIFNEGVYRDVPLFRGQNNELVAGVN